MLKIINEGGKAQRNNSVPSISSKPISSNSSEASSDLRPPAQRIDPALIAATESKQAAAVSASASVLDSAAKRGSVSIPVPVGVGIR